MHGQKVGTSQGPAKGLLSIGRAYIAKGFTTVPQWQRLPHVAGFNEHREVGLTCGHLLVVQLREPAG